MANRNLSARDHMGAVAALGCIVCRQLRLGDSPAEVHHIREGMGRMRASDFETIPLCYVHHRGQDGIHTIGVKAWHRRYGSERDLLNVVLQLLRGGGSGHGRE